MKDARRRHEWDQTAAIVAKVHNMLIADSKDAITVASVHPYMAHEAQGTPVVRVSKKLQMKALKWLGGIK